MTNIQFMSHLQTRCDIDSYRSILHNRNA